jgi:hypothetical protein
MAALGGLLLRSPLPPYPNPSGFVAHGCADGRFEFVVPRRVELLFRE